MKLVNKLVTIGSFSFLFLGFDSCKRTNQPELDTATINELINHVSDVMVHDITNPPLASRFFAYICLSGYEVMALNSDSLPSMYGVLNGFPKIKEPEKRGPISPDFSTILAMYHTAQKIQPSGFLLDYHKNQLIDSCRNVGFSREIISNSIDYALEISNQVMAYARSDHYDKTSNYRKYAPLEGSGYWFPTPPAYLAPVEPYFNTVRPFTLDSASQFKPSSPARFSTDKDSHYFKMLVEVYDEVNNLSEETRTIASFWDCNPFAVQSTGHLMVAVKKISPGAHWMGITGIACQKKDVDFKEILKIHTVVSVGLMDAFLSCWDEKYRSNRIRPETAIRKYIDLDWYPLLQTPPFPEYPSGHSVASACSAQILTYYLGDSFEFTDDVEVKYGIPERSFTSFMDAAKEAAISRLYGGIHYRDANENGTSQGKQVGEWVVRTIEKTNIRNKPNEN